MNDKQQLLNYRNMVLNKYQIYNSLFLNLPFDTVNNTGMLVPLLYQACQAGFAVGQSPQQILQQFLQKQLGVSSDAAQIPLLFQFIQYIERQIVLFDATEEAAYTHNHDLDGPGSMTYLAKDAEFKANKTRLQELLQKYSIRVVLTAHPTQFYPGPVLGIMTDLSQSIAHNDIAFIEQLLQQLGKTPLFNKQKPSPFDEATSLIWYLENVFYQSTQTILQRIKQAIFDGEDLPDNNLIQLGFWPGGDRDGNPYVDADTTLRVAQRLRHSILKCYYRELRKLKRRLTFPGVSERLEQLEKRLFRSAYQDQTPNDFTAQSMLSDLYELKQLLLEDHQSLFVNHLQQLIDQVQTFGFFFATLDIRQDSRVHHQVMRTVATDSDALPDNYSDLSLTEQCAALRQIKQTADIEQLSTAQAQDTLRSVTAMQDIQRHNGEAGANRYIISNCQSALNVLEVLAFFTLAGWQKQPVSVDIVPLFETIDDLAHAAEIMATLYSDPGYQQHLAGRQQRQTIMLGFSDGTKDGGYLTANWAIVCAKQQLSAVAAEHGVEVVFFDGRGGPPARGGGETHKFYAAQSPLINNQATQLTIQGQTISTNFGHQQSAQHNLEQLLSAGLSNALSPPTTGWQAADTKLLQRLADISYAHYQAFKNHPQFVPYLEQISTLKYYGRTNIGSRPTKRSSGAELVFSDLRAIPFVGAWSQLKQNVLGYYGLGEALKQLIHEGQLEALQQLYRSSGYFKVLIDNSMMSICKSFMPLTAYLQHDKTFGAFWLSIYEEFTAAEHGLKAVAQTTELLADQPLRKQSIEAREAIVLPLLTIQQFCLQRIDELQQATPVDEALLAVYEKLVTRSLYGNINASRNSV